MEMIRLRAFQSAARDCALAALAALALMYHWAGEPLLAMKAGGIGFALVAVFMVLRAVQNAMQDVEYNEIWINLKRDERPPRAVAKRLICSASRQACYTFGWYAAGVSISLWALTIGAGLTGL